MIEFIPLSWEYWDRWLRAGLVFLFDITVCVLFLNYITKGKWTKATRDFIRKIWMKL